MKYSGFAEIWTAMHPPMFRHSRLARPQSLVGSLLVTKGDSEVPALSSFGMSSAPPPFHPRMLQCCRTESPGANGTKDRNFPNHLPLSKVILRGACYSERRLSCI